MTDTLEQFLNQIWTFAPRVLMAIIIALVGLLLARIIAGAVRKVLEKIHIDKFGEKLNEIDFIEQTNIKVKISAIISKIFYYFLSLMFLIMAADVLAMPAISNLLVDVFNLIPKLLVGFFILIFGTLMSDMIRKLMETTLASMGISSAKMVASFIFYFLLINVVVVAISQAEIDTAFLQQNISILIAGGVLAFSIGYGLASKDVMSNFLSSFYSKDKFRIGDVVGIEGEEGEIIDIDRTSVTLASQGRRVVVPLSSFMNSKVIIIDNKRLEA